MRGIYDVQSLNAFVEVNPATMRGQELMDAGRVQFVAGANINFNLANGFKNTDTYCVAPTCLQKMEMPGIPCVSSLCLPIYSYESAWHVLFNFPNSARDTGFADRLVVDFSFVLMCVGFKASYTAEKSRHFWSIAVDIGIHVMRRIGNMYRMSRVQTSGEKQEALWFAIQTEALVSQCASCWLITLPDTNISPENGGFQ